MRVSYIQMRRATCYESTRVCCREHSEENINFENQNRCTRRWKLLVALIALASYQMGSLSKHKTLVNSTCVKRVLEHMY